MSEIMVCRIAKNTFRVGLIAAALLQCVNICPRQSLAEDFFNGPPASPGAPMFFSMYSVGQHNLEQDRHRRLHGRGAALPRGWWWRSARRPGGSTTNA